MLKSLLLSAVILSLAGCSVAQRPKGWDGKVSALLFGIHVNPDAMDMVQQLSQDKRLREELEFYKASATERAKTVF